MASAAAGAAAEASGDRPSQLVCESIGRMIAISASADVSVGEEQSALDRARAGAEETEGAGRVAEAARLWYVTAMWEGLWMLRCANAREAAERTRRLGQQARSPWLEVFGAAMGGVNSLMRGRGRIPDLLRAGDETVSRFGRAIRADYLAESAALLAQQGELDAALAAVADMVVIAQELGYKAYFAGWVNGVALLDAGRAVEAIEPLGLAAATAADAADVGSASSIIGLLARALALAGDTDEAARRSAEARALAAPSDRWSVLLWRGAEVRICAAQGRVAEAGRSRTRSSPWWRTSTTPASSSTRVSTRPRATAPPAASRTPRRSSSARSETARSAARTGPPGRRARRWPALRAGLRRRTGTPPPTA